MSKEKILNLARNDIGYLEKSKAAYKKNPNIVYEKKDGAGYDNYTKAWETLNKGMQGNAWCQAWINWLFESIYGRTEALKKLYSSSYTYYTPTQAKRFYDRGAWFEKPQVGDIVYYRNDAHKGQGRWKEIYHVELVESVDGDYINTIGGNTNNNVTSVEGNGGAVANKKILWRSNGKLNYSIIAGFGRPDYGTEYTVGWHHDDKGWWWADSATTWYANCWKAINGCWYYFGEDGYAYTGVHTIGEERFFFEDREGHPKECALLKTDERGALVVWDGVTE